MPDETPWARPNAPDPGGERAVDGQPGDVDAISDPTPPATGHVVAATVTPTVVASGTKRASRAPLLAMMGVLVLVLLGLAGGLAWYLLRDDSSGAAYATDKPNDSYDLESMQLRNKDLPENMVRKSRNDALTFTNQEWAQLLSPSDPARKESQLTAQKRVRNLVSVFGWDDPDNARIGQAISFLSESTLYETEEAAKADTNRLCGLRIDEKDPLKEFKAPRLGDQSVGFTVTSTNASIGKSIETVVCFRTGRIVHGVIQTSFLGSENQALVVSLAKRMLAQVDKTFSGKPNPKDEEPPQDPG